ncbi:MAG: UDP-N-acetylmuramoyl-tripeptide--D-alanyl-D-alanine ligase [Rhodospirillales bacterium]|jgi:UDP-N-acetylmuramoyl-tripeptide--D-alanyl-D-alanine ligase|nr:UDP-N-acetylmuramoyl-tripeptide--D-alanyl-D-alanine ligase [Rhodospirillales bacterium]MBT5076599.1 UDP-N-acetylmuramoyl-tripeptide--D-alanyl-D-alanine ligase [Rhodospirillales bacterium]MBT5113168.1 UDP-N-acetylmuramoyl-tripeptide--D-alanyl-D-alanine ligase [Rhodospirillales bacterium]MBT5673044.1 UDP-N-acetylmuramoyl-tripeptide--D-alanyl-D-alanine ligase [Rhodospirillales bacterium]MBT6187721.1 UDP-N-acetylmuramoyl-tripeptide--D-alanyl-D-alanine ligase [Rhodospirillales bacterium]
MTATIPSPTTPLWTATEAEAATGGHSTQPWLAQGVSIDTRTVEPGDLFIAIRGENRDAHIFLDDAFAAGAAAAMVEHIPSDHGGGHPLLIVDDTYAGLMKLARTARKRADAKIIAITGSVGKTSTKEALGAALAPSGTVTTSQGNLNNRWGVPLSLARMHGDSDFGVFEIGMNHAGEITPLSRLLYPEIAIITTVEAVHLEFFKSVEEIAFAKSEIFDGMRGAGTAILNRDNPYFDLLANEARTRGIDRIVSFGENPSSDVRLLSFRGNGASIVSADVMGTVIDFSLALPGRHSAQNAMAVLAAIQVGGGDLDGALHMLGTMPTPAGRGRRLSVILNDGSTATVIDDSYNASPASMRAAFKVLAECIPGDGGRRIAVLGDMLELGHGSARTHEGLAEDLLASGVDLVLTTGDNMMHLDDALPRSKRGGHTTHADELVPLLERTLQSGDVVLVKASNSQHLGTVVEALSIPPSTPTAANGG